MQWGQNQFAANEREREKGRRDEIRQGETGRPSCKGELHYCPSQLALIADRHIPQNESKKGNQKQFRFSLYAFRAKCQVLSGTVTTSGAT